MVMYPIENIAELNSLLQDPEENHLVVATLWLAQCTIASAKIHRYVSSVMHKVQKTNPW